MKDKFLKNNIILIFVAALCLAVGAIMLVGRGYFKSKTRGIEDSNIITGAQNGCIAYDAVNDVLMLGTQNNEAVAFKNGKEIWRYTANGAYREFVIDANERKVYAGNEDNHIYVYNLLDGTLIKDINTKRRIVAMDISEDGMIAVATSTGATKANVIIYDSTGKEILNNNYKIKINGIEFTKDGKNVIIGNNRGELIKLDLKGNEINMFRTGYTVEQRRECR